MASIQTIRTLKALRARVARWRKAGETIALVPTMGALHEGHLSLAALARQKADRVIVSVFVNPTQFAAGEDLTAYPRDEAADRARLKPAAPDAIYAPDAAEIYPEGFSTKVEVTALGDILCGASRPAHFSGVATVVAKLLIQAQPDFAVFGEKDWQQLVVVRQLVRDLDIPVRILGAPIVRAPDGLALSSRNAYLSPHERALAPFLHALLEEAARRLGEGAPIDETLKAGRAALAKAGFKVDYLEARDPDDLQPLTDASASGRLFVAAHLGKTRLIDNLPIPAAASPARQSADVEAAG